METHSSLGTKVVLRLTRLLCFVTVFSSAGRVIAKHDPAGLVLIQTRAVQLKQDLFQVPKPFRQELRPKPILEQYNIVPPYAARGLAWKQKFRDAPQEVIHVGITSLFVFSYVIVFLWILNHLRKDAVSKGEHGGPYRADIDGLRAVAVTAVTLYHLNKSFVPGGFAGVDMFFVISGYVVTASLVRGEKLASTSSILEFYVARIKRLVPACWLTIVVSAMLMALFIPSWSSTSSETTNLQDYLRSGQYALLSASNILFSQLRASYWDEGPLSLEMNPFTHMWSLGVEEQYYLVYPLLLFAAHGGSPSASELRKSSMRLMITLSILIVASCTAYYRHSIVEPTSTFYLLPFRFWELGIGCLLFVMQVSDVVPWDTIAGNSRWRSLMQFGFIILTATALFCPDGTDVSLLSRMLLACFATALFIVMGSTENPITSLFKLPPMVMLGNMSYPIYLWHWPIFTLFRWTVGLTTCWQYMLSMTIVLLLASLSYYTWEKPAKAWRPNHAWKVIAVFIIATCIAQAWIVALEHNMFGLNVHPLCPATRSTPISLRSLHFEGDALASNWTGPRSGKNARHRKHAKHRKHARHRAAKHACNKCQCAIGDPTLHTPPCGTGSNDDDAKTCFKESHAWPDSKDTFPWVASSAYNPLMFHNKHFRQYVFLGDSHARHPAVMLRHISKEAEVDLLNSNGCGYVPQECFYHDSQCSTYYHDQVTDRISTLKEGDVVALANKINWEYINDPVCSDAYVSFIKDLHSMLEPRGVSLILFGDNAFLRNKGIFCVPTWFDPEADRKCEESLEITNDLLHRMQEKYVALTQELSETYFFSFNEFLCDDENCGAFIPGTCTLAFYDEEHLMVQAEVYLAPYLCPFMYENGLL